MLSRFLSGFREFGWVIMIVLLPITSMPIVRDLIGAGTTVAAPSSIILLILICTWFIPYIIKGGRIPVQSVPLIGFVFVCIISTLLSVFLVIPPYKDICIQCNNFEGFITLGIGCSFFIIGMLYPGNQKGIIKCVKLLNWSGAVMLVWAILQAFLWYSYQRYPEWVKIIHGIYSVGALYRQRVSGFALEPSWFAHQLNMLYIPLWLAFTVRNETVHKNRLAGITIENILLIGGLTTLGLTLSRVGFLAIILMGTYLLLKVVVKLHKWLMGKLLQHRGLRLIMGKGKSTARAFKMILVLMIACVYAGIISGIFYGVSKADPRMAKMFQMDFKRPDAFMYYANELTFSSRVVYWEAGWNIFGDYPWLGVGLGNAGYFMPEKLSSYSMKLIEIRDLLYRSDFLLNIKALWVRLLAETGFIGFSFFVCWLFVLWRSARWLEKRSESLIGTFGLFGQLVLLGLIVEGFSIDSFALPYFWFSMGIFMAGFGLTNNLSDLKKVA